jgi:hypothetical protein
MRNGINDYAEDLQDSCYCRNVGMVKQNKLISQKQALNILGWRMRAQDNVQHEHGNGLAGCEYY